MRSSPSQRVKSSRDLDRRHNGIDRDIARLKAKILRNHQQIERIRQHNRRLTTRLTEIQGQLEHRDPISPVSGELRPTAAKDPLLQGATLPKFARPHPQHHRLVWPFVWAISIAILAFGCGCIGFAIARVILR